MHTLKDLISAECVIFVVPISVCTSSNVLANAWFEVPYTLCECGFISVLLTFYTDEIYLYYYRFRYYISGENAELAVKLITKLSVA